jgi:ubiquinone/menaquinone biosynthesis C-methylase UbiE
MKKEKIMEHKNHSVCPVEIAGLLDNKFRRIFHDPNKILKPYISKNMTALDIGCGPGVFSIEIAKLLEGTGKVISVDMQDGMLEIVKNKISGKSYEKNIVLHKCSQDKINIKENIDFVLMYFMIHEVPDKENLLNEVLPLINKNGIIMIVEPKIHGLSKRALNKLKDKIIENGFEEYSNLKTFFTRGIVLKKI